MRKKVSLQVQVSMVYAHFQTLWTERYGSFSDHGRFSGRDRARTSDTVKELGAIEIKKRIENYLNDNSQWLVSHNHPYQVFLSQVERYKRRSAAHGTQENSSTCRIIDREDFDVEREIAKWSTSSCHATA